MIQQVFARRKAYFLAYYRGANFDERPIRTADIGNGLTPQWWQIESEQAISEHSDAQRKQHKAAVKAGYFPQRQFDVDGH
jgi:hypothetical protein